MTNPFQYTGILVARQPIYVKFHPIVIEILLLCSLLIVEVSLIGQPIFAAAPVDTNVTIAPGETKTLNTFCSAPASNKVSVRSSFHPTGVPAAWVSPSSFGCTSSPGQYVTVLYTLTVPANQAPGQYILSWAGQCQGVDGSACTWSPAHSVTITVKAPAPTCPAFTMTVGLVGTAPTTGDTSARLQLSWGGQVPASVLFKVDGAPGGMTGSFAFNPANLLGSSLSVLMDVTTQHVADGTYPLIVTAIVTDPATKLACPEVAIVNVTVSATSTFHKFATVLAVQGNVQRIGPDGKAVPFAQGQDVNPGDVIKTNGGSATMATGSGTVKISGDATAAAVLPWSLKPVRIYSDDWNDPTYAPVVKATAPPSFVQQVKILWNRLASFIPTNCDLVNFVMVWGAAIDRTTTVTVQDRPHTCGGGFLITPRVAILPSGTTYTVNLSSDGATTIAMQEGSASVVDITSSNSITLNQGQSISVPYSASGLSQQALQAAVQNTVLPPATINSTRQILNVFADNYWLIMGAVIVIVVGVTAYSRRRRKTHRPTVVVRQQQTTRPQVAPTDPVDSTRQRFQQPMSVQSQDAATRFCSSCGKPVEEGIKFCGSCGAKLV